MFSSWCVHDNVKVFHNTCIFFKPQPMTIKQRKSNEILFFLEKCFPKFPRKWLFFILERALPKRCSLLKIHWTVSISLFAVLWVWWVPGMLPSWWLWNTSGLMQRSCQGLFPAGEGITRFIPGQVLAHIIIGKKNTVQLNPCLAKRDTFQTRKTINKTTTKRWNPPQKIHYLNSFAHSTCFKHISTH